MRPRVDKETRFVYIAHKQTARSPTTPSARRVTAVLLILAARRPRTAAVPTASPRWAAPATAVLRADRTLAVGAAPPRAARQAVPLEDVDVARPSAGLRCVPCARRRAERVVDFRRALHRIAAPAFVAVLDADKSGLGGGVGPAQLGAEELCHLAPRAAGVRERPAGVGVRIAAKCLRHPGDAFGSASAAAQRRVGQRLLLLARDLRACCRRRIAA